IVDADAEGLERPLAGLRLLEAAAVPGETLAADALANALGQVFLAEPDSARVAVAMSGGVDSAVALLRARQGAVGVTLRLRLDPRLLDRIWFPLGDQTKEETRAEASRAGLAVARRGDSQEACFLGGGDYREFLRRHGAEEETGEIVDEAGRAVGSHGGFWRFTPGQRRGLGVAAAQPLYVLRTDPRANRVVVGPRESLAIETISARGRLYVRVNRAEVKW